MLVAGGAAAIFASNQAAPSRPGYVPHFSHAIVIVLENKDYSEIIGSRDAPSINELAARYSLLTNYYAVAHPSQPNYLALVSGSTQGITTNCTRCRADDRNLADTLEAAGKSWKVYAEGIPYPGFKGAASGLYVKRHSAFLYFNDVLDNPRRLARIVSFAAWASDLEAETLPDYSLVVPDICHDMHSCPVAVGDAWLRAFLPPLLASPEMNGAAVFIVFDESSNTHAHGSNGGHVAALVLGPLVRFGARDSQLLDHYSLLRTIEQSWNLPRLGGSAAMEPISGIWQESSPPVTTTG